MKTTTRRTILWASLAVLAWSSVSQAQFLCTTNDGTTTITKYKGNGGSVVIPDTINGLPVGGIGNGAFWNVRSLTSITIPNCVTNVGDGAFMNCFSLTNVLIRSNGVTIADNAFFNCPSLTTVKKPTQASSERLTPDSSPLVAQGKEISADTQANGEEQDPQSKALLEQGLTSQQRGDSVQAAKYFRLAADRGSAWGQNNLGCSYMQGDGVRKDEATGARWIRKAAEQGLKEAQAAMGSCYTAGSGVEKDMAEGARWYRKAAEQGDAPAQHQLVLMYAGGIGVPKSNEEAARWAREAASRGDKEAQGWIAKWDARQTSGTAVTRPSAKVTDGVQDLGHRDPFPGIPQNSKRVVASYETLDAALTAKRGMNNHVLAGPYQAMEESVINAGNAVMTAAPQPKADVEFNVKTGMWDLFVVR